MNRNLLAAVLLGLGWLVAAGGLSADEDPQTKSPPEAGDPGRYPTDFKTTPILGPEPGVCRRDPSDVIRAGAAYYVWYTKILERQVGFPSGYPGSVWWATSPDGRKWTEQGAAVEPGPEEAWDGHGVFTPNILAAEGKYYLFYTAVPNPFPEPWQRNNVTKTAIGIAVAESPAGLWRKFEGNPVLVPEKDPKYFDSFRADDACLIRREGKYWLYYKGRQLGLTPGQTKMGIAIAEEPTGPYVKVKGNPVVDSGHEVLVWPQGRGVASATLGAGPQRNTWQFAPDGIRFRAVGRIARPLSAPGAFREDAFASDFPGKGAVTSYTFEFKFRTGADLATDFVISMWDNVGAVYALNFYINAATNTSWGHRDAAAANRDVTGPALAINTTYTARASWKAGEKVHLQIGGASFYSAAVATSLKAITSNFCVGANSTGALTFGGRLYYALWADGAQPLTGANTNDREQPLEDIKGEWHFSGIAQVNGAGAYYVRDRIGSNHLTATSLTNSDITLVSYETSGPWMLDRALRWNDYNWRLSSDLISRTSLGVLLAAFEAAGYNDASGTWFAGMLPPDFGSVMETSAVLREFCWALSCVPYVTPEGRLAFIDFDATTTGSGANVYDEQLGQIVDARLGSPLPKWNKAPRVLFDRLHRNDGSWGSSAVATNQASIDNYGLAEGDSEFALIGHLDYLTPMIKRHMLKRSGKPATATIALAGYDAWVEDIGSKPKFNLPNMRGQWQERPLLLYQVEDGIWDYKPKLTGIESGVQIGSIVVEAGAGDPIETEVEISASLDGFIGSTESWTDGIYPYTDGNDNAGYGTLNYQRHGHWYGYVGLGSINLGRGNINWRLLGRFPFAGWAGRTIISVESELVIEVPSMIFDYYPPGDYKSKWNGGAIHRCLITDWDNADSYNGINAGGTRWTDGSCVGASLGTLASGAGTKSVIFNAAGIAYVQAAASGTGDPGGAGTNINLTLQGMANGQYWSACKITAWKLRVVYV